MLINNKSKLGSKYMMPLVIHKIVDDEPLFWEDIGRNHFKAIIKYISNQRMMTECDEKTIASDWLITFDDGNSSDYEIAFPYLLANNLKAIFFVVTDWIDKPGYLSWRQVSEMSNHGMVFGSHGHSHLRMTDIPIHEALEELHKSRRILENKLGLDVYNFSFPYGEYNIEGFNLGLQAGYRKIYCSNHGFYTGDDVPIPRNSIHNKINLNDIQSFLNPSASTRLLWKGEDFLKYILKKTIGLNRYRLLRDELFK